MVKLLNEVGLNLSSSSEIEIGRKIKEELCYVALDPKAEEELYTGSNQKNSNY